VLADRQLSMVPLNHPARGRRVVVAQDTTEINFAGREGNRRGFYRPAMGFRRGFSSTPGRHR
jgi:hypothetical protein